MRSISWDNITVEQYQEVYRVNNQDLDEVDKIISIISILYDITENEINDLPLRTYQKLTAQIATLFTSEIPGKVKNTIKANGKRYSLAYDVGKFRLAQYIEAQHFIKGGIIPNLHFITASIAAPVKFFIKRKNDSKRHPEISEDILQAKFIDVYNSVVFFCEVFNKWNKGYSGLFGIEDEEESDGEDLRPETNDFNDRYGWIFSATKIREHEGITLDAAFNLPVIQAFNDLSYLKAYRQNEEELNKRVRERVPQV